MAIIRQNPPTDNFTKSTRGWLRDPKLSGKAKGYLSYIASHAEDYDLTFEQMVAEMSEGPAAVRAGLVELEKRGYLNRPRRRNADGTLGGYDWEIIDFPGGGDKRKPGAKIESGPEQGKHSISAGHNQTRKSRLVSDLGKQDVSAGHNQTRFSHPKKNNEEDKEKTMKGSEVKCSPSGRFAPSGADDEPGDHEPLILETTPTRRRGFEDWRTEDYDLFVALLGSEKVISRGGAAGAAGTYPARSLYDGMQRMPDNPKDWPGRFFEHIYERNPESGILNWLDRYDLEPG